MLVADADEAAREAAVHALTMAGVRVLEATDAASADAQLRLGVDAALVDHAIARHLAPTAVPVVVMSADAEVPAMLWKPLRSIEVLAALAAVDGFGGRPCVLVTAESAAPEVAAVAREPRDLAGEEAVTRQRPSAQRHWVERLSRHGAVVAGVSSPGAFAHAMVLLRPRFAAVAPADEPRVEALCRARGIPTALLPREELS